MLFDRAYVWSEDLSGTPSRLGTVVGSVEVARGDLHFPGWRVFGSEDAPLVVEVLDGPPPEPSGDAESVGEFDLLLPSGELVMEESGGGGGETTLTLPPGEWRARWCGFGEAAAEEREYPEQGDKDPRPDRYVMQLCPLPKPSSVTILRGRS